MNSIEQRIGRIPITFQNARRFAETPRNPGMIAEYINTVEKDFRPVAYEGIAMAQAVRFLNEGKSVSDWIEETEKWPEEFMDHIVIGLGWAFARKKNLEAEDVLDLPTDLQWRVFDGLGYHDAMFLKKHVIENQDTSRVLFHQFLSAYDQGMGRYLWYDTKCDGKKISYVISSFPESRKNALWRGIGVAATFVGGMNYENWLRLLRDAGPYSEDLKIGVLLVIIGRVKTNTENESVKVACKCVLGKEIGDINSTFSSMDFTGQTSGVEWYEHLIDSLQSSVVLLPK